MVLGLEYYFTGSNGFFGTGFFFEATMGVFRHVFALLLSLALLSSCGKSPRAGMLEVAVATDNDGIVIMNERLATLKAKEHIDARLTVVPFNSMTQKILTQVAAGVAPDVIWM